MKLKFSMLSIVAVIVLVLAARGAFAAIIGPLPEQASVLNMNNFIGDERAKAIALEQTGGGQVTLCRLSYNQDAAEYEVRVNSGSAAYLFIVNAYTGKVESFTRESQLEAAAPSVPDHNMPVTPVMAPTSAFSSSVNFIQPNSQNSIGHDRAGRIALDRVGGGTVVRTEVKSRYHKVIIVSGGNKYDVKINFDGSVRELKMNEITRTNWNAQYRGAGIGADSAKSIALSQAGGGTVVKCHLDSKKSGHLVYKMTVLNGRMEHKMELDAATGYIVKYNTKYKNII